MEASKDIQLKKIPAFTVLKNGSILKNIFLLRKPPPFSTQEESTIDSSSIHQESDEEILLVGRHPRCNITLEHPSISRYHLRIHSNSSSQKLSVIDLSSVHGTWVSGKRIESGVLVKLKEGDTVKMGSSSRVYELHWVPLSRAYDVDDPFIPAVYAFKIKQDGDCLCPSEDDLEGLSLGKLDPLTSPNCSDSCSDDTEVEHSSPSNGNGEISSSSLVQPSPVVLETRSVIEDSDSQNELENQSNWLGDKTSDEFEQLSNGTIKEDEFSVPNCSSSSRDDMEVEDSSPWKTGNESGELFATVSVQVPLAVSETISATEISDNNLNKSEDQSSVKDDRVSMAFLDSIMQGEDALDQEIAIFATVSVQVPLAVSETISATEISDNNLNKSEDQSSVKDDRVSMAFLDSIMQGEDALDQEIASDNEIDEVSECETVNQQKVENSPVSMALFSGVSRDENGFLMPLRADGEQVNMGCDFEQMNQTNMMEALVQGEDALDQDIENDNEVDEVSEYETVNQQKTGNGPVPMALFSGVNRDEDGFFMPLRAEGEQVNVGCDFEQMNQANMMDANVQGKDALDQDIENDNEIDEVSVYETVNQQKVENSPVSMTLFSGVSRDENGFLMPLRADGEQVNMGCDFEQMNQTNMMDALVQGEDALDQDIENDNEIDEVSEYETVNQQKTENGPVPMALFSGVNRDEDGFFMPLRAEGEQVNVGCDFEQMNQANIMDANVQGIDALDQEIENDNEIDEVSVYETVNQQKVDNSPVPMTLFSGVNRDENGSFIPLGAEGEQVTVGCDFEQMNLTNKMDESASVVLFDGVGSKVNDDVICSSIISRGEEVDMDVALELFDQETPKKDSVLVALPEGIHMDQEQTFTPDILRTKEVDMNLEALHNISVSMNLFDSLDGNELEIFTSGKENKNPNSCFVKSLKRRWKEDENEQSNHCSISKKAFNPVDNEEKKISNFSKKLFTEDMISFSSLEKETESRIVKMEGTYNPINYPQTVQKVIDSCHNIMGVAKKRWTMVVDTNSLLHNESLKHLKLLQGIIGTQLFVPKIVIRELTDIKGQDDILEKRTKKVSLALKWIDECMVDTKWWIHMDDEILNSSEAEPQVLETALRLRKEVTDRKIIILSNDLTLKIKAMAEGVICESAEEFRKSLVNPFSERFMWVGSSARGLTWSCVDDDDVLRQKYNGSTLNVSHRLKGLKLLANI